MQTDTVILSSPSSSSSSSSSSASSSSSPVEPDSLVEALGLKAPTFDMPAPYVRPKYEPPAYTKGLWRFVAWGPQATEVLSDKAKFDTEQRELKKANKLECAAAKRANKEALASYTQAVGKLANIDKMLTGLLDEYEEVKNFPQANLVSTTLDKCYEEVESITELPELLLFLTKYEWVHEINTNNFGLSAKASEEKGQPVEEVMAIPTSTEVTAESPEEVLSLDSESESPSLTIQVESPAAEGPKEARSKAAEMLDALTAEVSSLDSGPKSPKNQVSANDGSSDRVEEEASPGPAILHLAQRRSSSEGSLTASSAASSVSSKPPLVPTRRVKKS